MFKLNPKAMTLTQAAEYEWLDYSTLSNFMLCPRKYYWRMHHHLGVTNSAMTFGKAIHVALAEWNVSHNSDKSINIFIESAKTITEEDSKRNLSVGIETLLQYFKTWEGEPYTTIATEVGFIIEIMPIKGIKIIEGEVRDVVVHEPFVFVGWIDRPCDSPMGVVAMEHKTTTMAGERWLQRAEPNLQMEGYIAALATITDKPIYGGVLDIIHIHEVASKRKFQRIIKTKFNPENWAKNISHWMSQIRFCNAMDFHPENTNNCVPLMGYSCEFLELCSLYPNPYGLETMEIPSKYSVEIWNPYEKMKNGGENEKENEKEV